MCRIYANETWIQKAWLGHFLIKKSGSHKRRISGMTTVGPEAKQVKRLLGK